MRRKKKVPVLTDDQLLHARQVVSHIQGLAEGLGDQLDPQRVAIRERPQTDSMTIIRQIDNLAQQAKSVRAFIDVCLDY